MTAPESRPKVVAVIGSPRRRGNTATLVDAALEELQRSGCQCAQIVLADKRIEFCSGHVFCGERACPHDDDMAGILEQVYAADGLLLATPIYYENVSGQMKTFMDRNATRYYGDEHLTPKVVGLIAVAGESDAEDTLAAMRRFVALSNPEELPVVALGGLADKPGDAAQDAELMARARALGRSMAERLGLDPS
jgi:multimeric flavodoxin WrbA